MKSSKRNKKILKFIAAKNIKYVFLKTVINVNTSVEVKWEKVCAVFGKNLTKK